MTKNQFVVLFVVLCAFTGCENIDNSNRRVNEYHTMIIQKQMDACIAQGGIPILSTWSGKLKHCQFKGDKNEDK